MPFPRHATPFAFNRYPCALLVVKHQILLLSTKWFYPVAFLAKQSVTSRQHRVFLRVLFYEDQYAQNWICLHLPGPSPALKNTSIFDQQLLK